MPIQHHNRFSEDPVANRLDSLHKLMENHGMSGNLLVVSPNVLAVNAIEPDLLKLISCEERIVEESLWSFKNLGLRDVESMLDSYFLNDDWTMTESSRLCFEAKVQNKRITFASCLKGCGRWINTSKGCPFSNAAGLASIDMTVNEHKIIELWKMMAPLYSVTA